MWGLAQAKDGNHANKTKGQPKIQANGIALGAQGFPETIPSSTRIPRHLHRSWHGSCAKMP